MFLILPSQGTMFYPRMSFLQCAACIDLDYAPSWFDRIKPILTGVLIEYSI
jgi:hypothetical protein